MTPHQDLIDLALLIADDKAASDIECECEHAGRAPHGYWYDTASADEISAPDVDRAVRYLELRGFLQRRSQAPHIVTLNRSTQ